MIITEHNYSNDDVKNWVQERREYKYAYGLEVMAVREGVTRRSCCCLRISLQVKKINLQRWFKSL